MTTRTRRAAATALALALLAPLAATAAHAGPQTTGSTAATSAARPALAPVTAPTTPVRAVAVLLGDGTSAIVRMLIPADLHRGMQYHTITQGEHEVMSAYRGSVFGAASTETRDGYVVAEQVVRLRDDADLVLRQAPTVPSSGANSAELVQVIVPRPEDEPPAVELPEGYATIANVHHEATGGTGCLVVVPGTSDLTVGDCADQDGTTPERSVGLWRYDAGSAWSRLENLYLSEAGEPACLRTFAGSTHARTGACTAAGNATDYTSMRTWRAVNQAGTGRFLLENRYKGDAGRTDRCLSTLADGSVRTDACAAPADETALRQWESTAFPLWPSRPVVGSKRALVLSTHWTGTEPVDAAVLQQTVLSDGRSLRTAVAQSSRGRLDLSGDVLGDLDIGPRPTGCTSSTILNSARAAARARGVEPNDYDYLFVDIRRHSPCSWEGLAAMPGNWIISNGRPESVPLWIHEFGHNLGYQHSASLLGCPADATTTTVNSTCRSAGGNDPTDAMGGGGARLFPVSYQQFAGWLAEDEVQLVRTTGSYRLAALSTDGVQEYRIPRGDGSWLSLETRRPSSPFDTFAVDSPVVNGVLVRSVVSGTTMTNTYIDADPAASGTAASTLTAGRVLVDSVGGSAIRVCSVDAQGTDLRISVDGTTPPAC